MGASITVTVVTGDTNTQALIAKIKEALAQVTSEPVNVNVVATVRSVDNNAITSYNRTNKLKRQ